MKVIRFTVHDIFDTELLGAWTIVDKIESLTRVPLYILWENVYSSIEEARR